MGTAIALPWLEAMLPGPVRAAGAVQAPARRMAYFYVPNGVHMPDWTPQGLGTRFRLPPTLSPLEPVRDHLLVLSGLTLDKARANGDGGGDHARALSAFLTGCQAKKTHGADIRAGITVDQVAAQKVGLATKFRSLELGCDRGLQSGNCDTGYSCAYSANISWCTPSTPMAKEIDPGLVFERLFGTAGKKETAQVRHQRERYHQSILDFVAEDAGALRAKLGASDRRKIDEYLTGIRELEIRIARAMGTSSQISPTSAPPSGIPKDYREHIHLLLDLLVLAFQGDLTRIATFVFANEGSNRSYKFIGVPDGHHDLSHHGGNKDKQAKIAAINRFHMTQFAVFLERLKSIREGEQTLLDQCMIIYGSGIGDGNAHNHDNLPILLAGRGGGSIKTSRHVRYRRETPLSNLHLALLDRMGVAQDKLGDSTGKLPGLKDGGPTPLEI
jgi:hypothetical protein